MSRSPQPDGRPPYTGAAPVDRAEGDPQKVTGHAARRIVRGALPGGLLGAIVIGVIAAILAPDGGNVTAAALGGAAIGFVAGAVLSFVAGQRMERGLQGELRRTGHDRAHVRVDPLRRHRARARKAAKVADLPGGTLFCVNRAGRSVPLDETTSH